MKILQAIDGRFGKRVLKPQYRFWWRLFNYGILFILFVKFIMFPFIDWWSKIINSLNYAIWG